jgi:catechol 2,3-dioxygenase-like lactoylglutathione lyase family enzyme
MLEFCPLVSFVASADLARSRAFYEGVLGLPLERDAGFAWSFRAGGTTLRVTLVEEIQPAPYTVVGWTVPDIEDTVRTLMTHGIDFLRFDDLEQNELGIWRAVDGAQIAWFKDPDGNVLSLTQA